MDLNPSQTAGAGAAHARSLASHGPGEVPEASVEAMFRRAADEEVLWRGKPEPFRHAASAFHTNSMAVYFVILSAIAFANDGMGSAVTVAIMGIAGVLILTGLGIYSARNSAYVLTSHRLLILTGLAVDKRISIPLKHIGSASLKMRSRGFGDIALDLKVKHRLGYLLLWPHARSFRFFKPQPIMRSVPEAERIAAILADACAQYAPIERGLTDVKEGDAERATADLGGATA
ncbi:MAG: PH domain-containing protein [Erythrobacter sp.]|nr:PH domain-containing protein [Erythrobacter sp.]